MPSTIPDSRVPRPGSFMGSTMGSIMLALTCAVLVALAGPSAASAAPQDGQGERDADTHAMTQTGATDADQALAMLAEIDVTTTEAPGYQRSEFGSGWQTIQGCNTRNRVLIRDLTNQTVDEENCHVLAGTLNDPYTGSTITFTRDRPSEVQIDHVVPAAAAWRMGADEWTYDERRAWFNDMDNLLAVDGPTNGAKGDKTLGEWQPQNAAFHCDYAITYIEVSYTYDLSLKPVDVNYAEDLLPDC